MQKSTCRLCDRPVLGRELCATHYNRLWRIENAERYTHRCETCGEMFKTWRKIMASCSLLCQRRSAIVKAHDALRPSNELVRYSRPRSWAGTSIVGYSQWVQGPCSQCGTPFTTNYPSSYCSPRCRSRAKDSRRGQRRGYFSCPDTVRLAIYKRDLNVCQLCMAPVDTSLPYTHRLSATLDHIEPQSWALVPDHSPRNLRLAHRSCNSSRGDALR